MTYTRAQCARMLGLSTETLRYYEENGLLHVTQHPGSHRVQYTESDLLTLLHFRNMKRLGYNNNELFALFSNADRRQDITFPSIIARLRERQQTLSAMLDHLELFEQAYADVEAWVDTLRITDQPEREFLLLEPQNAAEIESAMQGQPFLRYGFFIDRRCLCGDMPWHVSLAINIASLRRRMPALHAQLMDSGKILLNGSGSKVYRAFRFSHPTALQAADFAPLLAYARAHNFTPTGDVFGSIFYPETVAQSGQNSFLLSAAICVR